MNLVLKNASDPFRNDLENFFNPYGALLATYFVSHLNVRVCVWCLAARACFTKREHFGSHLDLCSGPMYFSLQLSALNDGQIHNGLTT